VLSAKTVAPAFPKVRTSARRFRPGSGRSFAITFRLTRAATVTLTIRDAKGKVVRTIRVPKRKAGTVLRLRWDGRDTRGRFVKAGRYRFTIKAATSSKRASTASGSLSVLKAR
jgi:flagellar hook assembly protein FlgD